MSERSFSLTLLAHFMNQPIQVDTPLGMYSGTLRRVERSAHNGIGCLLLEAKSGSWLLIRSWLSVKGKV